MWKFSENKIAAYIQLISDSRRDPGDAAQGQSTCILCPRPWAQSPAAQKEDNNRPNPTLTVEIKL